MYRDYNLVTTLVKKDTDYSARITGNILNKHDDVFFYPLVNNENA
jgi:hypothetical protein